MEDIIVHLPRFAAATWLTVWLFATVMALSTACGALLGILAEVTGRIVRWPLAVYSWVFRGLPDLVVLLACYLVLPAVGVDLGSIGSAILGLTLIGTAFQFEMFRAGFAAIDPRQFEAARALGIPLSAAIRRIVLPQVARIIVKPWITYAAGKVKGLSIASAIAVMEVMAVTRQTIAVTDHPFLLILFAAAIYGTIASVLMTVDVLYTRYAQRRYGLGRREA